MKALNIITRTSGRPNFFNICMRSIRAQTYNNIKFVKKTGRKENERGWVSMRQMRMEGKVERHERLRR